MQQSSHMDHFKMRMLPIKDFPEFIVQLKAFINVFKRPSVCVLMNA